MLLSIGKICNTFDIILIDIFLTLCGALCGLLRNMNHFFEELTDLQGQAMDSYISEIL